MSQVSEFSNKIKLIEWQWVNGVKKLDTREKIGTPRR
jgi:hypothetical protein